MKTIVSLADMQQTAERQRLEGKRIAVVPTMGYLHRGHTSLIAIARQKADIVITTIFVNPTQFAPNEDFSKYPRDIERDSALAAEAGTDYLFLPEMQAIYPPGYHTFVAVEEITGVLEGKSRPTHFRGVTTIVAKLFNLTKPHLAIFGQKDAQQAVVIRRMALDLNFDVEIFIAPTVREPDGLALSSRNVYLTEKERRDALVLSRSLRLAEGRIAQGERRASALLQAMHECIAGGASSASIDYIAITDPETLADVEELQEGRPVLISLAVRIGATRLIDNTIVAVPTAQSSGRPAGI